MKPAATESFELFVSVLSFKQKGEWAAVALEMDIWGFGPSLEEAKKELADLVAMQVSFAREKGQPQMIYKPADPRYFDTFHRVRAEFLKSVSKPKGRPRYRALSMPIHLPQDSQGYALENVQA